jgi:ubiquinone/menaquinone biosynthesis C-methylase UbiE
VRHLTQADSSISFKEYFWRDIDLKSKVVLDAGTGFGLTTSEIAERIMCQKANSAIISVDIDPEAFESARKQLRKHSLSKLHDLPKPVIFIRADLSHIPIKQGAIGLVISTRTLADIESFSCRVTRVLTEFYRILKKGGKA